MPCARTGLIKVELIRTDCGTQIRSGISDTLVAEYLDAIKNGAKLPPIVVFTDAIDIWITTATSWRDGRNMRDTSPCS